MRQSENIIGDSAALAVALDQVSLLAPINRPALILGERGTGKELIAQRLHFLSPRWDQPFIQVNCAAIADQLLESELFGHEPGAFTGATRVHHGRFERANGGSLFLDELGTMSLRLQEKLLRAVEYGEFERLGGQQTLQVDVRIIAATNANLKQQASLDKFRPDLLDRLSFDIVHLPALHQRREDIPALAEHFAIGMCSELGWDLFPGFTEQAMQNLCKHDWPGNIRELRSAVERSIYRWGNPELPLDEIVIDPFASPYEEASPNSVVTESSEEEESDTPNLNLSEKLDLMEKKLLEEALSQQGYNQRRTAEALGISYDKIRGMVRKHGLSTRSKTKR